MTPTVYVIVEGGVVQYVTCTDPDVDVYVLDLDEQEAAPNEDVAKLLEKANSLTLIW